MPLDTLEIDSWEQVAGVVFERAYNADLDRYRSPYAFRGVCTQQPLEPGLHRLGHPPERVARIEQALLRSFRRYAHPEAPQPRSEWEWLSVAQHHGLPTRLLDWTYSPTVALHFATSDLSRMGEDGVVWMVDFVRARTFLPRRLRDALGESTADTFSLPMLEECVPTLADAGRQVEGADDFMVFFEPPSLHPRMVNQFALFSFMSRPEVPLEAWLSERAATTEHLARRLVIPARRKWEIRDKLDAMNVTERVMTPGLDGLSAWLARWYTAKSPRAAAEASGGARAARPADGLSST